MPRTVSSALLQDMYAQQTGEAILVLIKISHPDLLDDIRVTSDNVDTVSNGDTYVSFPFEIILPDEPDDGTPPRASLSIMNVSRDIRDNLASIVSPASVTMSIVRGSTPNVIEAEWPYFKLSDVTYDQLDVNGELSLDDFYLRAYPAHSYWPSYFPGLF